MINDGGNGDPAAPLIHLSAVGSRIDDLRRDLSTAVDTNTPIGKERMDEVASELAYAIQQIIINGAALLASISYLPVHKKVHKQALDEEALEDLKEFPDVVELDAEKLLAEFVHFCDICGKGFKRDANLRMHMRAHGNQFRTPEALAKPPVAGPVRPRMFSCPSDGCNRNRRHKKFRALNSVVGVRNHFKRSHCPKQYRCDRCVKTFSGFGELSNHSKHCGEPKWECSCGSSFTRKQKMIGHLTLFEDHLPRYKEGEIAERVTGKKVAEEDEDEVGWNESVLGSAEEESLDFIDNFENTDMFIDRLLDWEVKRYRAE